MNIVMVSAEAGALAKTGGLADAVWSLAKGLKRLGHSVTVVVPRYRSIPVGPDASVMARGVTSGIEPTGFTVLTSEIDGVTVGLVDSPLFGMRAGIYGADQSSEYQDNVLRFTVLGEAAVLVAQQWAKSSASGAASGAASRTGHTTILHGHDWPAGIALAIAGVAAPELARVITIHNAAYTGTFSKHDLHYTGLPAQALCNQLCDLKRSTTISLLEAGVAAADSVTTVSQGYAREIKQNHDGILGSTPIVGIVNGVDYDVWNPETDPMLPSRYAVDDLSGKQRCKRELQRASGLTVDDEVPVIGFIGRLVDQKGLEEMCFPRGGAIRRIAKTRTQITILGTGGSRYEDALERLAQSHPNVAVRIGFSEERAHLIEAGADLFLMPSRFEPCGLNQLYSLRYGTPPIVHHTGGLADTVQDVRRQNDGTGFSYRNQRPRTIAAVTRTAIRMWRRKPVAFQEMVRRGMALDFSWERASKKYLEVYEDALRKVTSRADRVS